MKKAYPIALVAAAGAMLVASTVPRAFDTVERVKYVPNQRTTGKTTAQPVQSAGEKIDDASITAQAKSSLMAHRSTSAFKTKVETTDGVVTLSGQAKDAAEKSLVTKLVNDIDGVKNVVNNMNIAVAQLHSNAPPSPPRNLTVIIQ